MRALVFFRWLAAGSIAVSTIVHGQTPPPRVFNGAPGAQWIAPANIRGDEFGVFHFRRVLALPEKPAQFVVHVSADNRYRLFVNGRSVATGPQRSDLPHWRYETIDLAPYLNSGDNVLGALVWNWGAQRPVAQFSHRTGFLLQANSEREAAANSGANWKVFANPGYRPLPVVGPAAGGYYAAPPGEALDGARYPWNWLETTFDDSTWQAAAVVAPLTLRGTHPYGEAGGWQLTARTLPPMEESLVRFARVRRADGVAPTAGFLQGTAPWTIPARSQAVLLLDQDHLTNAYANLDVSGGAGATIALTYAEALKDARGQKGHRDEIDGKTIVGVRDEFRADGGERRRYQTLWFRTYRYVQLEIQTADAPLQVHDLHGTFTAYPFAENARFACELPWISDMWRMNWRVARLCAWETYFDTPYYEQLQYVGDTRIQSLISYYVSGDDRLAREAIFHFDASRIPEGLTASRYPSHLPQYIPPFSLLWVAMVHDFWMHREDAEFVRGLLPGLRGVIARYERALDGDGLVRPLPWWNFVDWTWERGVPPGADDGRSIPVTLLLVYATQRLAELEAALGQPAEAARLRAVCDRVRVAIREHAWNTGRAMFSDTPSGNAFSQQTNTLAILTDTAPETERRALMEKILSDPTLTRATYYFGFYVREALLKAGLGDRYIEQLAPWREMMRLGLTTTPENPEPTRSDSHAWSAHPNYGLLATVLGVRPGAPGFRSVHIAPHLGPLNATEGSLPHPRGEISVQLERNGPSGIEGHITLPIGVDGVFEWRGRRVPLRGGAQRVEL